MGVLDGVSASVSATNSLDVEEFHGVVVAADLLAVGSWALDAVRALGITRVGHAATTALGELGELAALKAVVLGQERLERWQGGTDNSHVGLEERGNPVGPAIAVELRWDDLAEGVGGP